MAQTSGTGILHFIGIGGIGMSGIAELLLKLGRKVSGSDAAESAKLAELRALGATVFAGHDAAQIGAASAIVISSAIKPDNPELVAARARRLPVLHRSDMLAELMKGRRCVAVSGTHGKTTTTSMVARVLDGAGFDPTVVNGGIINAYGSNAKLGTSDRMVVEADESDGSFLRLPADIAVVTNIDAEHLDHFGTYDAVVDAFRRFMGQVPAHGAAIGCTDHPMVRKLKAESTVGRVIGYGLEAGADVRGVDLRIEGAGWRFSVAFSKPLGGRTFTDWTLPMPGRHNVVNALGAIAVGQVWEARIEDMQAALAAFEGVQRRFTPTGTWNGAVIIDDYAHNPAKIAAAIEAARQVAKGKVIAVVQPHRFTRLRDLFDGFAAAMDGADIAFVSDVYTAGETPIEGITGVALAEAARRRGRDVRHFHQPAALAGALQPLIGPGDYVVVLGAGSSSAWAKALPAELARLGESR